MYRKLFCSRLSLSILSLAVGSLCIYILFGGESSPNSTGEGKAKFENYHFNITFAREVIKNLCDLYKTRQVSGDYCNRLCYYGATNQTFLELFTSTKVVTIMTLGGQKTVLKTRHPMFSDFEQIEDSLTEVEFEKKLLGIVNKNLALGWPENRAKHLIEMLWPSIKRTGTLSVTDRRSLWALAQQPEFLTFSVLPLARVFPKVLGSCGHFYAVEHLVPFKLKSYYTNLKAKILVHMMGTLKLFYEFLNEPLHWCDVKFENFGLSADYPKRFLIMDADMLYTETRMSRLLSDSECTKDADCNFSDCAAVCVKDQNRCSQRQNDNVDIFCRKLVHQLFGSFWSKSNRYLAACHDPKLNSTQRLKELRLVWAWSLSDV